MDSVDLFVISSGLNVSDVIKLFNNKFSTLSLIISFDILSNIKSKFSSVAF